MGGKSSQNKGKQGEREVIALLQPVVDQVYALHCTKPPRLQRDTRQADGGGSDISGLLWASIEVKFHKTPAVEQWWRQCVRQAADNGGIPILFYRTNGTKWRVRMPGQLGLPSCQVVVPVDVAVPDFVQWFRQKLALELQ